MPKRTHVVLSEELVEEIDRIAGKRKRSAFIEEAVRERLLIEKQRKVLRNFRGFLDPADYPQWETPEKVSEWVANLRRESDERLQRLADRRTEAQRAR